MSHIQSALVNGVHPELKSTWIHWLEDIIIHDQTADALVNDNAAVLLMCLNLLLSLHPDKCPLFAPDISWCGRLLSADGWKYDTPNVEGLHRMQAKPTGSDLQKLLCALQWMHMASQNFASLVQQLQDFLEHVYTKAANRTKSSVTRIR